MSRKTRVGAIALGGAMVLMSGCTVGQVVENIDKNKTQIYVSVYNGGYGTDWLNEIKAQFEADYPAYQVIIAPTMDTDLYAGASSLNHNVYLTTTSYIFKQLVSKDLFADLSDIYEKTLPGETQPVKNKVHDYEELQVAFSYPGKTGMYAIPYSKSFAGFVYDHDLFKTKIDKGWLIAASASDKASAESQGITVEERNGKLYFVSSTGRTNYVNGDVLLRAGKDGKFGTYDDGQPITLQEWNDMLTYIKIDSSRNVKPVTYSEEYAFAYTPPILEAMFAQYEGLDNFELFYNYDGTYSHGDSTFSVKPEEGYKVYDMAGIEVGLDFFNNNLCVSDNIVVDKDSDHLTAQNKFLLYNQIDKKSYAAAMLVEGVWWENEAKPTLDGLAEIDESYTYGKRDFRYMLFPEVEGQLGIDGQGNGSVFSTQDYGLTLVANKGGDTMVEMSKKFVEYLLTDDNLRYFTEQTGVTRPFTYEMPQTSLDKLTKFGRTVYDIMQDTQNVKVVVPQLERYKTPLGFLTEMNTSSFKTQVREAAGLATYTTPTILSSGRVSGVSEYITGMKTYYESKWSSLYSLVKGLYEEE